VRHQNSVFHDLLKRVPWAEFDRLVAAHKADHRVRRLLTKSQFIALYGQLSGAGRLREIVGGLESHDGDGHVVVRQRLTRARVLPFFAKLPRCRIGIEACAHLALLAAGTPGAGAMTCG